MRIKIPITDHFLWALYNLMEDMSDISDAIGPVAFRRILRPSDGFLRKMKKQYGRQRFAQLLYYLKKRGIIEAPSWDPKESIIVTQKGMERIFCLIADSKGLDVREDGKYIMVIFDIPEKKRTIRNAFRRQLKLFGYKQLQQSVWISPFDVLRPTQTFIKKFNLEDHVRTLIVEEP